MRNQGWSNRSEDVYGTSSCLSSDGLGNSEVQKDQVRNKDNGRKNHMFKNKNKSQSHTKTVGLEEYIQYRISCVNSLEIITQHIQESLKKNYQKFIGENHFVNKYRFEDFKKWQKASEQTGQKIVKISKLNQEYLRQKSKLNINKSIINQLQNKIDDIQCKKQQARRHNQNLYINKKKIQQKYSNSKSFSNKTTSQYKQLSKFEQLIKQSYDLLTTTNQFFQTTSTLSTQYKSQSLLYSQNKQLTINLLNQTSSQFNQHLSKLSPQTYSKMLRLQVQITSFLKQLNLLQQQVQNISLFQIPKLSLFQTRSSYLMQRNQQQLTTINIFVSQQLKQEQNLLTTKQQTK